MYTLYRFNTDQLGKLFMRFAVCLRRVWGVAGAWLRCGCVAVVFWLWCGGSLAFAWLPCGCGVIGMWLRCGCCGFAVWFRCGWVVVPGFSGLWCSCCVVALWFRCSCDVVFLFLWLWCGWCLAAEWLLRYRGQIAVWLRCGCDVFGVSIWLQCCCGIGHHVVPYLWAATAATATFHTHLLTRYILLLWLPLFSSETDEQLFKSRLPNRIIVYVVLLLGSLNHPKDVRYCQSGRVNMVRQQTLVIVLQLAVGELFGHELLQSFLVCRHDFGIVVFRLQYHCVSFAEFRLEMLRTSETFELPVHHDFQPRTESLHSSMLANKSFKSSTWQIEPGLALI